MGKDRGCFAGSAVSSKERQESITREIAMAIGMAVVIIWLILTLTTTSWFEPFLFILVMAVAIVLNMGSNIMFGRISFFTFSTAAILQLAVSMDYSIFLLDAFTREKKKGLSDEEAMVDAVDAAINSIFASSLTTIAGFVALMFMKFSIGFDMGLVLAKGIVFSLLTVVFFMPAMIFRFAKWNEKTAHRPLLPDFHKMGRAFIRSVI